MRRTILVGAVGLICSGCVVYSQPPQSASVAQVEFRRDPAVVGLSFEQVLSSASGPGCKNIAFIGNFHPLTDALKIGGRKEFRADATKPMFLLASTYDTTVGANSYAQCTNLVSFTPQAGRRYAVTQFYRRNVCKVALVDLADGSTPPSVEHHEVTGKCEQGRGM